MMWTLRGAGDIKMGVDLTYKVTNKNVLLLLFWLGIKDSL